MSFSPCNFGETHCSRLQQGVSSLSSIRTRCGVHYQHRRRKDPLFEDKKNNPRAGSLKIKLPDLSQARQGDHMDRESRRVSLKWKIGGTYAAVMLILSGFVIAAVYQLTKGMLRDQLEKRAIAVVSNLSDASAGHLAGRNLLGLHALLRKYSLLDGVAYALIRDNKGEIIAHTLEALPPELSQGLPSGGQRETHRRELSLRNRTVYETSIPVLEGQVGSAHVGFWADAIEKEMHSALLRFIGIIAIIPFVGILLSFILAHWIVRPIVGLTEVADKVTRGDLDTSVSEQCVESRDEIGDLARSLERMRSSLKAAMMRLERETA
jgi:HAMP domain-containing protein